MTAAMITPAESVSGAPRLRGQVRLEEGHGGVRRASLAYTAFGVVEAVVNGQPVSADVLTPGWSSYEWRLRYAEADVTALVSGVTVVGLTIGNGWYRGRLGWDGGSRFYGDELAGWAQLRVTFEDGHEQLFGTDDGWLAGPSEITSDDLYDGQSIDARLRDDDWTRPDADLGAGWGPVRSVEFDESHLEAYIGPPVRRQEELAPVEAWTSSTGSILLDFGQNLVGWVRVEVTGDRDSVITLRHAEVLSGGSLAVAPLRTARATDSYVLSGGQDRFEPTFTFHGFRYVEVEHWPGGLEALLASGGLTAIVVSSDLRRIGHFESSDASLNRLHENAVWGMRGNFLDVPTDCPQRDERMGWTGDLAVFAPTAAFLYDIDDFLQDWLRDLSIEQSHQDGMVPFVIPDVMKYMQQPEGFPEPDSSAIWADAAVWVPWSAWMAYGDQRILRAQLPSMVSHMRRVRSKLSSNGLWDAGFQFGDWLDPDAPAEQPWLAKADAHVIATACAFRSATMVADTARVLAEPELAREFDNMAHGLRVAFNEHYVDNGIVQSDAATVYALAITFGLLSGDDLDRAGTRLAELVAERGYRIATGFAGTPFVTDALSITGHLDVAYRLLFQTEAPSWLYAVSMGATTIWERWDSLLPDGSVNPGGMTSFNHYALGAVIDWVHRVVGGIAPLEPGYRRILVAPRPGGELTWARTALETPYGRAVVAWNRDDSGMTVEIEIPEGSSATLRLPGLADELVGSGAHVRHLPPTALALQA